VPGLRQVVGQPLGLVDADLGGQCRLPGSQLDRLSAGADLIVVYLDLLRVRTSVGSMLVDKQPDRAVTPVHDQ
jgi:hypothetical protein